MDATRRGVIQGLLGGIFAGRQVAEEAARGLVGKVAADKTLVARALSGNLWPSQPQVVSANDPGPEAKAIGEELDRMIDAEYGMISIALSGIDDFRSMSPAAKRVFRRMEEKRRHQMMSVLHVARHMVANGKVSL